ncbi:hypothetical protein BJP25_01060 [Actinokineospora bangkokensis]|uniref:Protein kinase domain-containing protein n=1 Tax=Actinokineospora bangkokensis TaxID=1193682 RepID=A0A1Q9LHF9_9PSEU|nr:hypothetical protein BJP25_01060 [Actinokineospora bangkokensis]
MYKRYKTPPVQPAMLREVVALRSRLDQADREFLDERTTWPLRVVHSGGSVVGILMRRIPEPFGDRTISAGTRTLAWELREVSFLFIDPTRLTGAKLNRKPPTREQRLAVCREFAELLDFFHTRLQVVFGDINARNELYRLDGPPSVMFIDCDGVRPVGAVADDQLNAPDWEPPRGTQLGLLSDRYKFGLFVLRALNPGEQVSTKRDPRGAAGHLDAEGYALLCRALDEDPGHQDRPTAHDWWRYFSRLLGEPVDPPELTELRLDRGFVVQGQPVQLHWRAENAKILDVVVGGKITSFDATAGSGTVPLWLDRSAHRVDVLAINRLGESSGSVGPVAVIPPPTIDHLPVALPEVPQVAGPPVELPVPTFTPLPDLRLPAVPGTSGPLGTPKPFSWPALPPTSFPYDLTDLLLGGPAPHDELFARPEEKS